LEPLGKFDANYFLPAIARLSSTYLEIVPDSKDKVIIFSGFAIDVKQLDIISLGVSALGKKRHRVEIARRLIFGSLLASFENQKTVLYPTEHSRKEVLFRVLDRSLPWWADRDKWGRWTSTSSADRISATRGIQILQGKGQRFSTANSTEKLLRADIASSMTLQDVLQRVTRGTDNPSQGNRISVHAMYSAFIAMLILTCRPGHVLHNMSSSTLESPLLEISDLMELASRSAGDIAPAHIFTSQYLPISSQKSDA